MPLPLISRRHFYMLSSMNQTEIQLNSCGFQTSAIHLELWPLTTSRWYHSENPVHHLCWMPHLTYILKSFLHQWLRIWSTIYMSTIYFRLWLRIATNGLLYSVQIYNEPGKIQHAFMVIEQPTTTSQCWKWPHKWLQYMCQSIGSMLEHTRWHTRIYT